MPNGKRDLKMGQLVKVKKRVRVGCKCHLRNVQKPCRAKQRRVLECVSETVGLRVVLLEGAVITSSPGAISVKDLLIDKLKGQYARSGAEVVKLTVKVSE